MGRLQSERRGARWPAAELDPNVPADRHICRRGERTQLCDARLRLGQGIGMNLDEGDERPRKRDSDQSDEHRPAPSDRLLPLVLLEGVDDSSVEALADGRCRVRRCIGRHRTPALSRSVADPRVQLLFQLDRVAQPGERWRKTRERLQNDPLGRSRLEAKDESQAVSPGFNVPDHVFNSIPFEGFYIDLRVTQRAGSGGGYWNRTRSQSKAGPSQLVSPCQSR